jgi:hypothetical protein
MLKSLRLDWYWNRLRCMSAGEVLYRVKNKIAATAQQRGIGVVKQVPTPNLETAGADWFKATRQVEAGPYLAAAGGVMDGRLDIFSLADVDYGTLPDWNRDPRTGVRAPLEFGKTLNYRDEAKVGDIKYLWEPNRHLQLVWLCQAFHLSNDEKYRDAFRDQLDSWFAQCPYLRGPNWTSSLELGIRLINWSICWQLVGGRQSALFDGAAGEAFLRRWLDSIYQHCHFIAGHWSRYSSANNHLIGEAAGLLVGAITWPYWRDSARWRKSAFDILSRESQHQTGGDGVNREQAISYQQFVFDFLLIAGFAARVQGQDFSAGYWNNIERMIEFIASVMDCAGNVPMIGDADDGYAVSLSREADFCPYRSMLNTGAVLFDRPALAAKAGRFDDKTRWLLGDGPGLPEAHRGPASHNPVRTAFPEGGYYILGSDYGTDDEIRMVVDAGPLGYRSIAAHGHADALALVLSVGGEEILIDPGTYAYHTQKQWRDYFRGTAAHNTVCVDHLDQSVSGGNFMWLRHASIGAVSWQESGDGARLSAQHDGYRRLPDGVVHARSVRFERQRRRFVIEDQLTCKAGHEVQRFWHFGENCRVEDGANGVMVRSGAKTVRLILDSPFPPARNLYKGSEQPLCGWVSRRFDVKQPTFTLVESYRLDSPATLRAVIECV